MPTTIARQGELLNNVSLTNSESTSQGFVFHNATSAALLIDGLSVGAGVPVTITYYAKGDASDTKTYLITDTANAAISHTTQLNRCIVMPESVFFPFRYVIPVLSSGTGTVRVCLKG